MSAAHGGRFRAALRSAASTAAEVNGTLAYGMHSAGRTVTMREPLVWAVDAQLPVAGMEPVAAQSVLFALRCSLGDSPEVRRSAAAAAAARMLASRVRAAREADVIAASCD